MYDLTKQILEIPPPFNMVVLIVLIFSCAGVITSVAKQLRKYGCQRSELEFKRELLDRGMSAEEIERTLAAQSKPSESPTRHNVLP